MNFYQKWCLKKAKIKEDRLVKYYYNKTMKITNTVIFISFITFLNISCKKESLKGDSSILIGKWQKSSEIDREVFLGNCTTTLEKYNISCSPSLEFKKNGRVILNENGIEKKYSLSFSDIEGDFSKRKNNYKIGCSDINIDSIDNHYRVSPYFYSNENKETYRPVIYVNENKLIIKMDLIPNYELIQKLASFGSGVKILSPENLIHDFKSFMRKTLQLYS